VIAQLARLLGVVVSSERGCSGVNPSSLAGRDLDGLAEVAIEFRRQSGHVLAGCGWIRHD
jgi:hypothetical protein